ncbi:MAG: helix-hairpin-helix domain-containing protein [Halieaceae bacterium]
MTYSYLAQLSQYLRLSVSRLQIPQPAGFALAVALALTACAGYLSFSPSALAEPASELGQTATVNINKADASALAAGLTGVGLSRAQDIVRYREAYGPFAAVEELTDVKGIGASTLEKNRSVITLD